VKKESIKLTLAQRQSIEQILSKGKALAWTLKHAQVLLKVDRGPQGPGWSTSQIVEAFDSFLFMLLACCQLVAHPVGICSKKKVLTDKLAHVHFW
jgi:hypothetical protein